MRFVISFQVTSLYYSIKNWNPGLAKALYHPYLFIKSEYKICFKEIITKYSETSE